MRRRCGCVPPWKGRHGQHSVPNTPYWIPYSVLIDDCYHGVNVAPVRMPNLAYTISCRASSNLPPWEIRRDSVLGTP